MTSIHSALLPLGLLGAMVVLVGCNTDGLGPGGAKPEVAMPANMAGLWLFSSPGRGQCRMTFGAAAPSASEGTIAPQGGCPGKFYMSRKWTTEEGGLVMRDHNSQPLAQLSTTAAGFEGKAASGEPVTLMR